MGGGNPVTKLTGGLFGQRSASRRLAGAAGNAALAQQAEAREAFEETRDIINPATTEGLAALNKQIASQEKNLSRLENLAAQIDPTVIEASQQALKLLRGEESSVLDPVKKNRQRQRQQLLDSLREQLGPGAETSSAGRQALQEFDATTNQLIAGAQQNQLTSLGNLTGQFRQAGPDLLREISGLSALTQGRAGLSFQQADTLRQARQPLIQTAGAGFVGQQVQAQQDLSFGNRLLEGAFQLGSAALTPTGGASGK